MNAQPSPIINLKPGGRLSRSPLLAMLLAFALGISGDHFLPLWGLRIGTGAWLMVAAMVWPIWAILLRCGRLRVSSVALFLGLFAVGAAWHHQRWNEFPADELGRRALASSTPVAVELVVTSPLESQSPPSPSALTGRPLDQRTIFHAKARAIRSGRDWQPASGRVKVSVDGQVIGVGCGDVIRVFGYLSAPPAADNPGAFDSRIHDRQQRILCRLHASHPSCVSLVEAGRTIQPSAWLGRIRAQGRSALNRFIAPDRADLAAAVLLGMRESVPHEESEAFMHTGTIHLLVVSGLHLGMLAAFLFWGVRLGVLPRRTTLAAVGLVTLAYALLADANPPVIRAMVLVILCCTAAILGRPPMLLNSLSAGGLLVLAASPLDLFRTGTQLSFLAVATLIYFGPRLSFSPDLSPLARLIRDARPWYRRAADRFLEGLKQVFLAGGVIWLVSLPLVMMQYHLVTPIALLVNPLVCPLAAVVVVCGFGVLLFSWPLPPLAWVCGWACNASLGLLQGLIHRAESVPGAYFFVAGPALWWVLATYGTMGLKLIRPVAIFPLRWRLALAAVWLAAGQLSTLPPDRLLDRALGRKTDRLDVTFLSVGHGTAVLIELPDGRTLLYDCGSQISPTTALRSAAGALWSRGIGHLDAVVLSHSDIDHYNGLPQLLDRFSVGRVYVSPVMFRDESREAAIRELHQAIVRAGVPIQELESGDRLQGGENVRLVVLHPPRDVLPARASDNAQSIVLLVEFGETRLLLPGDLEKEGLTMLLDRPPLACDAIMAPHHGSNNSHPTGFAAWTTPRIVVMSGGRGHDQDPAAATAAYQRSGATVLHTGQVGAVRLRLRPHHQVELQP